MLNTGSLLVALTMSSGLLIHASELCVQVNDPGDLPLPNAWVNVTAVMPSAGEANPATYHRTTNSKGRACLSLPEGSYAVEVGMTGFLNVRYFPVRVIHPHTKELSFRLPFGDINGDSVAMDATVSGILQLNGKPMQWAKVCLLQETGTDTVTCGTTNEFGEYALSVPLGTYKVEIRAVDGGVHRSTIKIPRPGAYRNELTIEPNQK